MKKFKIKPSTQNTTQKSFDPDDLKKLFAQETEEAGNKLPAGCLVEFKLISIETVPIAPEGRKPTGA